MRKINKYEEYIKELHLNPLQIGKKKWSVPNGLSFYTSLKSFKSNRLNAEWLEWLAKDDNFTNLFGDLAKDLSLMYTSGEMDKTEATDLAEIKSQLSILRKQSAYNGDPFIDVLTDGDGVFQIYSINDNSTFIPFTAKEPFPGTQHFLYVLVTAGKDNVLTIGCRWVIKLPISIYSIDISFRDRVNSSGEFMAELDRDLNYPDASYYYSDRSVFKTELVPSEIFQPVLDWKLFVQKYHEKVNDKEVKKKSEQEVLTQRRKSRQPYYKELQETVLELTLDLQDIFNGDCEVDLADILDYNNLLRIDFLGKMPENDVSFLVKMANALYQLKESLSLPFHDGVLSDYVNFEFTINYMQSPLHIWFIYANNR